MITVDNYTSVFNSDTLSVDIIFEAKCRFSIEALVDASVVDPSEMHRVVGRELLNAFVKAKSA
jgi:hypothetical protein